MPLRPGICNAGFSDARNGRGRPESKLGHYRNLTDQAVKFFPVYSYLIVYRPDTRPLQVVSILHGRRDVEQILKDRL
jgi:plasmid stabilization system protein ParE